MYSPVSSRSPPKTKSGPAAKAAVRPPVGNQPSFTENRSWDRIPSQKIGRGVETMPSSPPAQVEGGVPEAGGEAAPTTEPDPSATSHGRHRQLQRGREPVLDRVPDRAVGGDGLPEVEGGASAR